MELIIFAIVLLQRSLYRILFPDKVDHDSYFHWFTARLFRDAGHLMPKVHYRFVIGSEILYPFFYHWLLSFFPKRAESTAGRFINPLMDALFSAFLVFLVRKVTGADDMALMAGVMFLCTPLLFTVQKLGPRTLSATPRLFGEVAANLYFIGLWLFMTYHNYYFLAFSLVMVTIVYLSSKFSVQAIIFISIAMFFFTFEWIFLALPAVGMGVANLISGGRYRIILKNQYNHLSMYFKMNLKGKMEISKRNSIRAFIKPIREKNLKGILSQIFQNNSFTIIATLFPLNLLALWFIFTEPGINKTVELSSYFILSGMCIFLLTSIRFFLFIGEAERYPLHVIFFTCFFLTYHTNSDLLYFLIPYLAIFMALDIIRLYFNKKNAGQEDIEIISYLNQFEKPMNIATVPFYIGGGWRILYDTQHNWLMLDTVTRDKSDREKYAELVLQYPFINLNKIGKIAEEYNLQCILINTKQAAEHFDKIECPSGFREVRVNENIIAFEAVDI